MTCLSNYSLMKLLSFWYWIQLFVIVNCYFNNITAIVVPPPGPVKILRIEDPKNRELIDVSKKKAACDPQQLSPILSCIDSFMDLYLDRQINRGTVFVADFVDLDVEQVYLSTINKNRPSVMLSSDMNITFIKEDAFEIVILLETPESVEYVPDSLIDIGDDDCRYGVILTQKFQDEESFMEVAQNLTEKLWDRRIANAAILGTVKKSMVVARSTSFVSGEIRRPSSPLLMDKCNSEKDWDNEAINIFAQMDFNNCSIYVAYFLSEPYIHRPSEDSPFSGVETSIFTIIAQKYGIHIDGEEINWENGTTMMELYEDKLKSNRDVDLILGGILWEPEKDIDFTVPYDVVQVVWLIPMHANISLQGLIAPLSTRVWCAVIAVIICAVLLRILLFKEISLLEVVALVIGVGWPKQPEKDSSRFQFISYVLFGFLLVQFYLASMAGQFLKQSDIQIETMVDLVASGLKYGGTVSHQSMFQEAGDTAVDIKHDNDILKRIAEDFIIFDQVTYDKLLQDLNQGENTSVALVVTMNMTAVDNTFDHRKVHILKEVVYSFPLAFPVWKGLPYLNHIDNILRHLIEGDIIGYIGRLATWEDGSYFGNKKNAMHDENLRLNDLAPGFLLLVIGNGLGLVCLLLEIAWKKFDTYLERKQIKKDWKMLIKVWKQIWFKFKKIFAKKNKKRKNKKMATRNVINSRRVIVQQVLRPNVKIGYYKDMY